MSDTESSRPSPSGSRAWLIVAIALALSGMNSVKPLVIDDVAFFQVARQISQQPTDPYGFEIDWEERPKPAITVLAPPVLPYWWAAGMRLLGDEPIAWKLWLFPFAWLLVFALAKLGDRLAPGGDGALLCLVVLSPALWPALNLMVDLPALALGLAAMALGIAATERSDSVKLAVLAGVCGGLAMLTKYTALVPVSAGLVYALLARRPKPALISASIAAAIFCSWELFLVARYGESQLSNALVAVAAFPSASALAWSVAFLCLLGCASSALLPWMARAIGAPPRAAWAIAGAVVAAWLAVSCFEGGAIATVGSIYPVWSRLGDEVPMTASIGLGVLALGAFLLSTILGREALRGSVRDGAARLLDPIRRLDVFVLVWLGLEVVGFFALSPYPALRRIIGVHVALTVAVGRASWRRAVPRVALRGAASLGIGVGLLFTLSDLSDATTRRTATEKAAAELVRLGGSDLGSVRWYSGHWGFQFYAERAGMRPVVADRSRLERGDLLAVARGPHRSPLHLPGDRLERIGVIPGSNPWPWTTLPGAYAGHRPLRPQPAAQIEVVLYRVTEPFEARWVASK